MDNFIAYCYGDEESRNKPVYKDGTFWTMLSVAVVSAIVASLGAVPWRATKYAGNAFKLLDKELFFVPIPEWIMPFLYLAIYVTYFLATYLMYRKINANTDISAERRNKAKSYLWLLFIIVMVAKPLWSFTYLGMGEAGFAFLFAFALIAAVTLQAVLTGQESWGGSLKGAWYLVVPMLVYLAFVAVPLNILSAFTKSGKSRFKNRSVAAKKGSSSGFTSSLNSLAP